MSGDAVVLDGDAHESALTEKRGWFQEVCGCGWRSSWTTDEAAGREHAEHVAGEKLWARLTEPQKSALDELARHERCWSASKTANGQINGRAANSLVREGYAVRERTFPDRTAISDRGRSLHPLERCSARYGGDPCGYCHACRRRLPTPNVMACPHCGATDWDE